MEKRYIEVPSIYPMTWDYSAAIETRGGRTLYISGIVGARKDGTFPAGDIVAQAELAFANLSEVLKAAGGTLRDIVKVQVYVGEDYGVHAAEIRKVRSRYFPDDYPTSTLVRVAGFANPVYLFEIEAIAVLPEPADAGQAPGDGLRVVRPSERLVVASEQTPGMVREGEVSPETTGSRSLWSGYVITPPGTASGSHHHGDAESAIWVVSGTARFRWGDRLEQERVVEPGDFLYVPPRLIHAEENLSKTEPVIFIVSRNSGSMLTVNVPEMDQPATPASD